MTEPVYWRITQEFRHAIESGYCDPATSFLPESELKDEYRTSRNTVCDAKKCLTHQGLGRDQATPGHLCGQAPGHLAVLATQAARKAARVARVVT